MYLTTTVQDGVTHILDDSRQLVRTDMWMGISQDVGRRTMLAEDIQYLLDGATFLGARVEFTVRVGSCPTLAKAVVALGIHLLRLGYLCQVTLAFAYVLATFQHHRTQPQLDESEGSKQATRSGPHHNDLRSVGDIGIVRMDVLVVLRHLVDVRPDLQVDKDGALSGIDAASQDAQSCQRTHVEAILLGNITPQCLLVGSHMGLNPYLILVNHSPASYSPLKMSSISAISSSSNHLDNFSFDRS